MTTALFVLAPTETCLLTLQLRREPAVSSKLSSKYNTAMEATKFLLNKTPIIKLNFYELMLFVGKTRSID